MIKTLQTGVRAADQIPHALLNIQPVSFSV